MEQFSEVKESPQNETKNFGYKDWLLYTKNSSQDISQLVHDKENGTTIGVSNGSYDTPSDLGTTAQRIETQNMAEHILYLVTSVVLNAKCISK